MARLYDVRLSAEEARLVVAALTAWRVDRPHDVMAANLVDYLETELKVAR